MRLMTIVCMGVVLAGCATAKRPADAVVSRGDMTMFVKTFEGTLVNKTMEEFDQSEPRWWWPFSPRKTTGVYLKLIVANATGTRSFFGFSKDEEGASELRQYNRELKKGDMVVIDLGYIDDKTTEEPFDRVTKKMP